MTHVNHGLRYMAIPNLSPSLYCPIELEVGIGRPISKTVLENFEDF